jgi:hypothetical protein
MRSTLLIAAATFALSACGGDGGGGGTGPKIDILLTVVCSILQPDFNPTLLKAEALIDGQVVGQEQSSPATATLLPGGATANLGAGAHTVGCRVVTQTASPTVYEISAGVNATRVSGGNQDINLGPLTKSLATGDVVTFNVTVNP